MMHLRKYALVLVISLGAAGCTQDREPPSQKIAAPVIDLSTPDRALKSYWALREWLSAVAFAREDEFRQSEFSKKQVELWKSALSNEVFAYYADYGGPERFEKTIQKVEVESESRAVIVANIKNVTPIPAGRTPDKYSSDNREKGENYRYVLEKASTGWQIAEIYELDYNKTWAKRVPNSPSVPSLTYSVR